MAVSVRDWARFGLLYLRNGTWQDQQLIGAEQVQLVLGSPLPGDFPRTTGQPAEMIAGQRSIGGGSNQYPHEGSYSYAWWTNGIDAAGMRIWPSAPLDVAIAHGHEYNRA